MKELVGASGNCDLNLGNSRYPVFEDISLSHIMSHILCRKFGNRRKKSSLRIS
jgi:hypothetical protein